MALSNNVVGGVYVSNQYMPVFYVNSEFLLQCLMDVNRGLYISEAGFVAPVSIESDGYALNLVKSIHSSERGLAC